MRVVLLSGRSANFLVEVNSVAAVCLQAQPALLSLSLQHDSNCRELFQQVVSYQSLGEQHVFGLAVVRGTLRLLCCSVLPAASHCLPVLSLPQTAMSGSWTLTGSWQSMLLQAGLRP